MLESKQMKNVCANNGREALKIVKARAKLFVKQEAPMFKIILMDYSMPEMDGPTTVKNMKKLFERNAINVSQQPYICCCTAYDEITFKKKAKDAGMD